MPEKIHSHRWISLQEVCDFLDVKKGGTSDEREVIK
jgi:hypothetical protein